MFFRTPPARLPLVALALGLVLGACAQDTADDGDPGAEGADDSAGDSEDPAADDDPVGDEEPEPEPEPEEPTVDPADVDADELGQVPVLMYHQLLDDGGGEFDMTPEQLRTEFTYLFEEGYVPVSTADFARGEFDVPAGKSPVVLTFDDSTRSQAWLTDDGEIHPDSAIGILLDVADDYEDVEPVASLYVISGSLFGGQGDGEEILAALHDAGMEIGNHTHTHPSLASLDADGVQEELARNVDEVTSILGDDADVATLALPLGQFPQNESLAVSGEWEGTSYEHEGVLLVGYNPAPSPFAADFDPAAIPRMQANVDPDYEFGSRWWLNALDDGGDVRRYVSDGDPETVSFPQEREDELAEDHEDRANPY